MQIWRWLWYVPLIASTIGRLRLKCDGTRVETIFRLSARRTSPFKSAVASVQSTTDSWGVRISVSNAGYTMSRGSVKGTGYPLHSPVSLSLPLPCVTVCHHISTGVYCSTLQITETFTFSSIAAIAFLCYMTTFTSPLGFGSNRPKPNTRLLQTKQFEILLLKLWRRPASHCRAQTVTQHSEDREHFWERTPQMLRYPATAERLQRFYSGDHFYIEFSAISSTVSKFYWGGGGANFECVIAARFPAAM